MVVTQLKAERGFHTLPKTRLPAQNKVCALRMATLRRDEEMLLIGEFGQWVKESFVEVSEVDLRDARQISAVGKLVHAIVKSGFVEFDGETWRTNNADWTQQPSLLLSRCDNSVWVYEGKRIWAWDGKRWQVLREMEALTAWSEDESGAVWLVSENALWRYRDGWEKVSRIPFKAEVRSIACWHEQVALATSFGFWFLQGKRFHFKEL
ncbi:MAG: hypothetical protein ACK4I8_09680, partial [Armatimonadota bacterium]